MVGGKSKMVTQTNCFGCSKKFRKKSKSGYCADCFHSNIHGVKSKYSRERWDSGKAKKQMWKFRGAVVAEENFEHYQKQENCQICEKVFDNDKCLDHDHETGEYRGALCRQCNAALGKLGDNLDLVISRIYRYKENIVKSAIIQ